MKIPETKHFIPEKFELGTTLSKQIKLVDCLFCRKTWFKNRHFSDDGDLANLGKSYSWMMDSCSKLHVIFRYYRVSERPDLATMDREDYFSASVFLLILKTCGIANPSPSFNKQCLDVRFTCTRTIRGKTIIVT